MLRLCLATLVLIGVSGCSLLNSQPNQAPDPSQGAAAVTPTEKEEDLIGRFENELVNELLDLALADFEQAGSPLPPSLVMLHAGRIENSVDANLLDDRVRARLTNLDWLRQRYAAPDFTTRINTFTLDNTDVSDLEAALERMTTRASPRNETVQLVTYEDSESERQRLLNDLVNHLINVESASRVLLPEIDLPPLGINAESHSPTTFGYRDGEILVNFDDMTSINPKVLEMAAGFYGVPGVHVWASQHAYDLQAWVDSAALLGWALFALGQLDLVNNELDGNPGDRHRLIADWLTIAEADLYLGTGQWSRVQAAQFLTDQATFEPGRSERTVAALANDPGRYIAAVYLADLFGSLKQELLPKADVSSYQRFNTALLEVGLASRESLRARLQKKLQK